MHITIKYNEQSFTGDLIMYREEDYNRLCFLIKFTDSRLLLIELSLKTGQWRQIGGDAFLEDFGQVVFERLGRVSVFKLLSEEQPIENLFARFPELRP